MQLSDLHAIPIEVHALAWPQSTRNELYSGEMWSCSRRPVGDALQLA